MDPAGPLELALEEQQTLLTLARETLRAHVQGLPQPTVDDSALGKNLLTEAACFVTLNKSSRLRGCILDSFIAHEPVYRNVMRNVILAARADDRFQPVTADELSEIDIEISVLGSSYPIQFDSPEELLAMLRPEIDGVIITTTFGSSTFLPQVWEQLPEPDLFLGELCRKHGAPGDCWQSKELLQVKLYQVNHFGETAHDGEEEKPE